MYKSLEDILDSRADRVHIASFFPYDSNDRKVRVPESAIHRDEPHVLFEDVDYDRLTTDSTDDNYILSYEKYSVLLDRFVRELEGEKVDVSTEDYHTLYELYLKAMSMCDITGVALVVEDVRTISSTSSNFVYIPPEYVYYPASEESFYLSMKRVLPELVIDYANLNSMYNAYLDVITDDEDGDIKVVSNKMLDNMDLIDISNLVDDCFDRTDLSIEEMKDVANDVNRNAAVESEISEYLEEMHKEGIRRERVAKNMLVYHPDLLEEFINKVRGKADISEGYPAVVRLVKPKATYSSGFDIL